MVRFPKCRTEVLYPTPGRSGREEPITPPAMFVFPPPADVPRRRAGAELHCWFTSEKKSEHLDCTSFPPAIGIVSETTWFPDLCAQLHKHTSIDLLI